MTDTREDNKSEIQYRMKKLNSLLYDYTTMDPYSVMMGCLCEIGKILENLIEE